LSIRIFDRSSVASGHQRAGPRLPTWALQQVGSYLGYTGRDVNVVAKAALDPIRTLVQMLRCKQQSYNLCPRRRRVREDDLV
jgi:hypothetical protein